MRISKRISNGRAPCTTSESIFIVGKSGAWVQDKLPGIVLGLCASEYSGAAKEFQRKAVCATSESIYIVDKQGGGHWDIEVRTWHEHRGCAPYTTSEFQNGLNSRLGGSFKACYNVKGSALTALAQVSALGPGPPVTSIERKKKGRLECGSIRTLGVETDVPYQIQRWFILYACAPCTASDFLFLLCSRVNWDIIWTCGGESTSVNHTPLLRRPVTLLFGEKARATPQNVTTKGIILVSEEKGGCSGNIQTLGIEPNLPRLTTARRNFQS
ncbi:hypothetical protein DFH06DRAFT_1117926 [Mycena polygramma]|nr:hypothetical protein DFH06DRAFT_1117926 [Mycena polygramma]